MPNKNYSNQSILKKKIIKSSSWGLSMGGTSLYWVDHALCQLRNSSFYPVGSHIHQHGLIHCSWFVKKCQDRFEQSQKHKLFWTKIFDSHQKVKIVTANHTSSNLVCIKQFCYLQISCRLSKCRNFRIFHQKLGAIKLNLSA